VKEVNKPDKIVGKESRKGTESEEDEGDEGDDDDDDDAGVGAAAVVIHERPVVLQAPLIGRPFVKQTPHFLKTVVGQQPSRPSSSQASQLQKPEDDVKPSTGHIPQSVRVVPAAKATVADQKSGTLQLGEFCCKHSEYANTFRL
jgi:hypothetical protein